MTMNNYNTRFITRVALGFALAAGSVACDDSATAPNLGETDHAITDVDHSDVERQSIGNCWLYAQASWVESLTRAAGRAEPLDASQSYWTYWHWFDQVSSWPPSEISTGGWQHTSHQIVLDRGLMVEGDFLPEDSLSEMSSRQSSALSAINTALKAGRFRNATGEQIRAIFDEAWGLSPEVRGQLDKAFGKDGAATLRQGATTDGTKIVDPKTVKVRYTKRVNNATSPVEATLVDAIDDWALASYPDDAAGRRKYLQRVQRALHDRQPVVITWDVDFNAMANSGELAGSFNLKTLTEAGGPGRQGGHMTVLEDYAAETTDYGLLEAGVTLDPSNPEDAKKLAASLLDSTKITLLRTKNSWGASRADRGTVAGFPGYHDLHMDYLNGPIRFCPNVEGAKTEENCRGESNPLREVLLPPGY